MPVKILVKETESEREGGGGGERDKSVYEP